jgi:hypothetical protein
MKTYGGSGCIDPCFLISALVGDEWSATVRFIPDERPPGTRLVAGWAPEPDSLDTTTQIPTPPSSSPQTVAIPLRSV